MSPYIWVWWPSCFASSQYQSSACMGHSFLVRSTLVSCFFRLISCTICSCGVSPPTSKAANSTNRSIFSRSNIVLRVVHMVSNFIYCMHISPDAPSGMVALPKARSAPPPKGKRIFTRLVWIMYVSVVLHGSETMGNLCSYSSVCLLFPNVFHASRFCIIAYHI